EKCVTVFCPELRKNKKIERFRDSRKSRDVLAELCIDRRRKRDRGLRSRCKAGERASDRRALQGAWQGMPGGKACREITAEGVAGADSVHGLDRKTLFTQELRGGCRRHALRAQRHDDDASGRCAESAHAFV